MENKFTVTFDLTEEEGRDLRYFAEVQAKTVDEVVKDAVQEYTQTLHDNSWRIGQMYRKKLDA